MGDTEQFQPSGTGSSVTEATAALAEIQRRQEQVIRAVLVPGWYWWVMAAGVVAIGAARDNGGLVQAITIPLAVVVMAALTGAMIPAVRRRVQVHPTTLPGPRGAAAIIGLIVMVNAAIMITAASLAAAGARYPATIATAAGATVLVIAGPLVNRYLYRLMAA